ncbi:helix-turn-helix domain-containing protein [Cohnella panacarvi]|uniref:helix-turn-helix domain-containing protein n=1 Tax=Cohnella panacarvi TaxID=400776 RepID=UPI000479BF6B|nr:helix-turn-helix transcriptional regulator [Cohnella panacarvi]
MTKSPNENEEVKNPLGQAIAGRIEQILKSKKITKVDFAKKLGISTGNMGDWSRGKSAPGANALVAISEELGVSLDWLVTGQGQFLVSFKEEHTPYFFDDLWQSDCRFEDLSKDEKAFIKEYVEFSLERRKKRIT